MNSVEITHVRNMTRVQMLQFSAWLVAGEQNLAQVFHASSTPTDQNVVLQLYYWARYGAQSVVMPDTYAAALMATDVKDALEGQQLPWPAFEIHVPSRTLFSSCGEVKSVFAARIPDDVPRRGKYQTHELTLAYIDDNSWGVNTYPNLAGMFDAEQSERSGKRELAGDLTPELESIYDADQEKRLWSMITRLVGSVALSILNARTEKLETFPLQPFRVKHGATKPNTVKVGRPLKIDCRSSVRDFVQGTRAHGPQTVQTLVRGHWRQQAYGPQWQLHRPKFIEPFFRGDGPLLVRPTKLGFGR